MSVVLPDSRRSRTSTSRALIGCAGVYVLLCAAVCTFTGPGRPAVLVSDVLTGWATLPRNIAALIYLEASDLDVRALATSPAVLTMDVALTALVALINVLLIGGLFVALRSGRGSDRRARLLAAIGALLLTALCCLAVLSAADPYGFYGTLFRLPVD